MTRNEAYTILTKYLNNPNLLKHSLATEAAMKALFVHLHKDDFSEEEQVKWGITGLMHDADYELMPKDHPEQHGMLLFEKEPHIPDDIAHAIKAHNFENTKVTPETEMAWAITSCDQLTGLIVACALVRPEKTLASVTVESVLKKFNNPGFARGAQRHMIQHCEEKLGIPLPEFIATILKAMQEIHTEMGL